MLRLLNGAGRRLQPLRPVFWVLLAGSIVGFALIILGAASMSDSYAILCLVLCLWSMSLLVVVACFPRQLAEFHRNDNVWVRLRKHVNRGFTWLVAIVTVLVNLAVIMTTFRLGGILVGGLLD